MKFTFSELKWLEAHLNKIVEDIQWGSRGISYDKDVGPIVRSILKKIQDLEVG